MRLFLSPVTRKKEFSGILELHRKKQYNKAEMHKIGKDIRLWHLMEL